MIITEKPESKQYLEQLKKRYKQAGKKEKKVILDEFTKTTGHERKYAIKLLRGWYRYKQGKIHRPRRKTYTYQDAVVLARVCDLLSWINSKRVQPQIEVAIDSLIQAKELRITEEHKKKLIKVSASTIDRLLVRYKRRPILHGHSYTKPGTLLKNQIPIRTFSEWNENKVGFCEIDLVGHDGGNASGQFAYTLNFVDVKSCWCEQVAVRNKAQQYVFSGIKTVKGRLPFPLLGVDSDSGSEFINDQLFRYCTIEKITFTRGRPGKKNDNPYVEQKNDSIVRRWIGYGRYDTEEQVNILNKFYEVLRLYANFFLPVQKLSRKEWIGSRIKKVHDKARTPYQRVLKAEDVSLETKGKLTEQYKTLNLVYLKTQIDNILKRLKPTPV